jgi:hypothetical protein
MVDPNRAAERLAREAIAETRAIGAAVTNPLGKVIASAGTWPAEPGVAVRIGANETPFAVVLLGPRRDRQAYDRARLDALAEIGALAATAPLDGNKVVLAGQRADAGARPLPTGASKRADTDEVPERTAPAAPTEASEITPLPEEAALHPLRATVHGTYESTRCRPVRKVMTAANGTIGVVAFHTMNPSCSHPARRAPGRYGV